ncbi:MAG: metallophosphoesterase family protein [Anaerolineae bacterium]|nr:metallophosphoesterase family protein [Anaerolineae bacterium]
MRYIVVSDIHSNAPAFEAVLQDAPPFDAMICLGDIVGYGPDPNECVARVQDFDLVCLSGNHDQGTVGKADILVFNRDAREALTWTQQQLSSPNLKYLAELPASMRLPAAEDVLLAHGSARDPVWEYLVDISSAQHNFEQFAFQVLLVGHSHLPLVFEWLDEQERVQALRPEPDVPVHLDGRRLIFNPGSVGQPRDGNPMASYGLLDLDAGVWIFRRVAYPVEITQERMRAHGLPSRLVERLAIGR